MSHRWALLGACLSLGALALTEPVIAQSGARRAVQLRGRPASQPAAQPAAPAAGQPAAPPGTQPVLPPELQPGPGAADAARALEEELGAPRPVISLLLLSDPVLNIAYNGDFGPMRITGTLVDAPEAPIRITLPTGGSRLVPWTELFAMTIQRIPQADVPLGAFTVTLSSEEGALPRSTAVLDVAYGGGGGGIGALPPPPAVATAIPPGALTLIGEPYNALRVPTDRITELRMVPIRGTLASMPTALIGVEVRTSRAPGGRGGNAPGKDGARSGAREEDTTDAKIVEVPLDQVELYRRDPARQLVSMTLADGQIFTGRLVFLPNVSIGVEQVALGEETARVQNFALARIAQFERSVPRAGGVGGP